MPNSEYNWNWRRNLPPVPSISLFDPAIGLTNKPWGEAPPPIAAPVPAPVLPDVAKNQPPIISGPGAAGNITAPGVTGTALQPGLLAFGSPGPVGDPEKTWKERALEATLQNKDFMGGLAMLAKAATGKVPTSRAHQMSDARMGAGLPDLKGAGGNLMAQALAKMAGEEWDLTAPPTRKRKPGQQARYDILRGQ